MKHNGKFYRFYLLLMAAILLLSLSAATFARYVTPEQVVVSKVIAPETFLVESDVLTPEGADYQLWQPSAPIPAVLYNYEAGNRCSVMDVNYSVTAVGYVKEDGAGGTVPCMIRLEDGDAVTGQTVSGTLPGGLSRELAFTVAPQGEDFSKVEKIVVTAECGPYERTLSAVFHINGPEDSMYEILDTAGEMTARLVIKGGGSPLSCRIHWNGSLYPDRTDPAVSAALEAGDGHFLTLDLEPAESVKILFFKKDPSGDYSRERQKLSAGEITVDAP